MKIDQLWPTPIGIIELPEYQKYCVELQAQILSEHLKNQNKLDGSTHNVWNWKIESVNWLRRHMTEFTSHFLSAQGLDIENPDQYWGRGWANVLKNETDHIYQPVHAHHEADLFTVFYVNAGESDQVSGSLVMHDSRNLNNTHILNRKNKVTIVPKTGHLLIAPGYIWHEVSPYLSYQPRISIACNFQYSAYKIKD
jgi:uncharacterized protein (TIGR02466 family)